MWTKSHSIVTTAVTKEQMWKLFTDVNRWPEWDEGLEFTQLQGRFEPGNQFVLKPKGGPKVNVQLLEMETNRSFLDVTKFPLARMYDHHIFEETPQGLKITNTISVRGPLSFLWIKLVAQNLVNALPADMEKQIEAARRL